jgi:PAS domain S-box-containing protein
VSVESSNPHLINRTRGRVQLALPALAICAGLILTVVGVLAMRGTEYREAQLEFDSLSETVARDLESHLNTFLILARATTGMVNASEVVTRQEWLAYVGNVDPQGNWPGFRGMVLAPAIQSGAGQFRIPIRYIAPSNPRNDAIVGFDFMSEPLRAEAVLAARDRGEPIFTAPLTLLNDDGQREVSVALMTPYFRQALPTSIAERREAFAGIVVVGIGLRSVVNHVFEDSSRRGMKLRITDLEAGKPVFDWADVSPDAQARHSHNATLQTGGRDWLLQFASTPRFEESIDRGRSRMMAVIGLLVTMLLAGTAYQQTRMRQQAELRAQAMTRELRDSEQALQQHLTRFSDLAELSADWFWEQDAELRFSRFWGGEGSSKDVFLGKYRWEMPIDLTPAQWEAHKAVLAARQAFRNFEYPVRFSGEVRWYAVSGKPLYDEAGRFVGYRGTGTDVTERKVLEEQLQRQLKRFGDLVELSADWFWEQDVDLRFTYFSNGLERSGIGTHQYIGLQRWDLPIDFTPAQWEEHKALLAAHEPFRNIEYRVRQSDGSYKWFENSGVPVFEKGQFAGYRGIGRDITQRKEMEEELRRHRDHLVEMVELQTADLLRAKEVAERANQAKSEFLTNMSHELRTPLHAVLAFARLGHMRVGRVDAEKLQEYFDLIRNSGNHLLELVDDLLDLSKLETGNARLAIAAVDLRQRVAAVTTELSALLESKHLACRVVGNVDDARVLGDPKRLDQLLRNLIGNAIKFSPAGSSILIELAAGTLPRGRRQDDVGDRPALRLTIADEGVGIPVAELETIFDKFIQSSLTADGSGGTGLGLAICREIVHAHRGIIRARNRDEGGAAFEVLLPQAIQDSP